LRQALWIVLAACATAFLTYRFHPNAPRLTMADQEADPAEISPSEAAQWRKGEVVWVDARTESEYAAGHVPEAVLLRTEHWDRDLFEEFDELQRSGRAVVYDGVTTGWKAAEVARRLRGLGIREVYVLRGDWREMVNGGR
jgi:rhodanese-related sulfurtransferase